ncbi:peptidase A2 [Leptospira perolatii]|uniref:Peptidase A2 n=1 Tax=Leptospira perolatii TaxID=2023191 RepID=A0A2M9ZQU4_9LEPT|nr:peptidase A2 [Leptospira perolatii]PJZ74446.1 peptidase A2 [Leptospira perolatii]
MPKLSFFHAGAELSKFRFFRSSFLFFILLFFTGLESAPEFSLLVHYKKYSHQNPFQKGASFQKRLPAVRIDESTIVTLFKPGDIPLFAEIHPDDAVGRKAYFQKVDIETGLALLVFPTESSHLKKRFPIIPLDDSSRSSKGCSYYFPSYEWASLDFSKAILPLSRNGKKEGFEGGRRFLFGGGKLCGFTDGSWNASSEVLRRLYSSRFTSVSPFPHPGFISDASLTPSEESYYFPRGSLGTVVSEVLPGIGPVHNLFPGDAILEVNGVPVGSKDRQALYELILTEHGRPISSGEKITLTLFRDGRKREVSYNLKPYSEDSFLIPERSSKGNPKFLISGGMLFTELTQAYLKEFGDKYKTVGDRKLVYIAESFSRKLHPEKRRIVLLSRIFPDEKNSSYQDFQELILESLNGQTVDSVDGLKSILANSKEEFFVFRFSGNKIAVFTKSELNNLNDRVKAQYSLDQLDNID